LLAPLRQALTELLQLSTDPIATLKSLTDLALEADRQIDRVWLRSTADHIRRQHDTGSERIHATFAVHYRDRQAAVRFISTRVVPLESCTLVSRPPSHRIERRRAARR
jgi:hypothetical protein